MNITELSNILRNSGVVGAGGAGFPSYAKLNEKADTIILNCAECEPLLKLHRQLLEIKAREILSALNTVSEAIGAEKIIIAIKPSYKKAVEAVKREIEDFNTAEIKYLPEAYPSGDEVVTIYETTGRVVEAGKLPISVGVIVYNVETMFNAYNAVVSSKAVTEKYITVTGAVKSPVTVKVPIGITYKEVIELAGGATIPEFEIVAGGPMTGPIVSEYDVVTKTTNALIVLPPNHYVINKKKEKVTVSVNRVMSACCQCNYCTDLCPRNLLGSPINPAKLMRAFATKNALDTEPFLNSNFCSACNLCTMFSCFQGLNPAGIIATTRAELRKNGAPMPTPTVKEVNPNREGRRVSVERLVSRLGLADYNHPAPLTEVEDNFKKVKIMLSQHIGAPAVTTVSVGSKVNKGDLIATAERDKLSVPIHSSIDGTVSEIHEKYIIITR